MMFALYRMATIIAGPFIGLYLGRRRAAGKEDSMRFPERQGYAGVERPAGSLIWIHAASVGESLSALPLVERLLEQHPGRRVLVTTGTVTSAGLMVERLPDGAFHQYVPIDRPAAVARFLDHWRPDLALWTESEFWPNLIAATQARGIPMVLVNGRMSDRSFRRWGRFGVLIHGLLAGFTLCLAQSERDAERLRVLGANDVRAIGNLKSVAPPLPAHEAELEKLRAAVGDRPLWLAASTHDGEEAVVASVHKTLAATHRRLLTIIVPRHPDRGEAIAQGLRAKGLAVARRAAKVTIGADTEVYVADTMGELGLFYRLAEVVFVGGSLVPHGGQNPLEPARLGCAVVYGPYMANFTGFTAAFARADATRQVEDGPGLAKAVGKLFENSYERARLAAAARRIAEAEAAVLDEVEAAMAPLVDGL